MTMQLNYDVSTVGFDGINIFKSFIEHWLDGFCIGEFHVEMINYRSTGEIYLSMTFNDEKDFMVAKIKDFPSSLSKFRVLH